MSTRARVRGFISYAVEVIEVAIADRIERPWLALVAIPLAITASMDTMAGLGGPGLLWLTWLPLLLAAWWWAPRRHGEFRSAFPLALEAGVIGIQWSFAGAVALGTWPELRGLIAGIWIGAAAAIAAAAAVNRLRLRTPGL